MGEAVAVVRLIREQLKEVVGSQIASAVAETRIQQLLQLYGEEEEGIRCVLHTLLEEVFNEEDQDGFVVFDREEIASVSTLIYHVIVMPIILACHTFSCQTCNTSVHCMLIAHSITSRNFQSKNWFCKMLTFKQGFLSMKLIQRICFSTISSEK